MRIDRPAAHDLADDRIEGRPVVADAAMITTSKHNPDSALVVIEGEIVEEDLQRFLDSTFELEEAAVLLRSPRVSVLIKLFLASIRGLVGRVRWPFRSAFA